jgi:hypothetical protein
MFPSFHMLCPGHLSLFSLIFQNEKMPQAKRDATYRVKC